MLNKLILIDILLSLLICYPLTCEIPITALLLVFLLLKNENADSISTALHWQFNPIRTGGGAKLAPPGIDHLLFFEKCRHELQTSYNFNFDLI